MDEVAYIETILPWTKSLDKSLKQNKFNIYKKYIMQSEIPASYQFEQQPNPFAHLSCFKSNKDLQEFINDVTDFIDCEYNCVFNFSTSVKADNLAAHIVQNYIKNYLRQEETAIKTIIYINAPLLFTDLKRVMGFNSNASFERTFVHRRETIEGGVESADLIIWDNLNKVTTEYERGELYKILSIRHKRGLSNLFFNVGGYKGMLETLGTEISDLYYGCDMVDIE